MTARSPDSPDSEDRPAADGGDAGTARARFRLAHERFHEALALAPGEREPYLARLETSDPELAREVRGLLAADADAAGFLAEAPALPENEATRVGERFGPYRLTGEIGRGGMGVVYRAVRDDDSFAKDVAIKLVEPGMRSPELLQRFRAERQILARLEHPHIARLLDGGTATDGTPYLVMEFVQGRPLLADADERRLDLAARLRLFLAICEAVQFAHERLVVHRDLKSDNVLVAGDGAPRLLDFGIARVLSADGAAGESTQTLPLHRRLTPDYASPEQIRGEPAAVASDVYSLGVIFYELLAGTRPLRVAGRTTEEMLRVATHEESPPPSAVVTGLDPGVAAARALPSLARLRDALAGDLDAIALRALDKDARRRYATVEAFADDVRRHLDGRPVVARRPSRAYRFSRFVRRHRVPGASGALVALALLAGLGGIVWQASVARRERDRAVRRFDDVRQLAHAVVFDLHDAIANLPGSTRAREQLVTHALRYLDGLSREAADDPKLLDELAGAYVKIGDVQGRPMFANLGRADDALESYDHALALLDRLRAAQPESTSVLHNHVLVSQRRADVLAVLGRTRESLAEMLRARDRIRAELAKRPDDGLFLGDLGVAHSRLVDLQAAVGDTAAAIAEAAEYVTFAERVFRANPTATESRRGTLIACTKMAELLAARGLADSVVAYYRRATGLAEEAVRAQPGNTEALRDLSIVYGAHGTFLAGAVSLDSGLVVYDRGMAICETLARQDPANVLSQADLASGHFEIGTMLLAGARPAPALREFSDACGRFERLAEADPSNQDFRASLARSEVGAADACAALAGAPFPARERWRASERNWLARGVASYRVLAVAGVLTGEDSLASKRLEARLAALAVR